MAREKGMGNLQQEKSGRWTMRVGLNGKRYCRSTRTKDRDKAERILQRFLAPLGLGEHRLPLAEVWLEYVKSPLRNELAPATLHNKQLVWMHFAKWMEHNHLEIGDLAGVTADAVAEYLACQRRMSARQPTTAAFASSARSSTRSPTWRGLRMIRGKGCECVRTTRIRGVS